MAAVVGAKNVPPAASVNVGIANEPMPGAFAYCPMSAMSTTPTPGTNMPSIAKFMRGPASPAKIIAIPAPKSPPAPKPPSAPAASPLKSIEPSVSPLAVLNCIGPCAASSPMFASIKLAASWICPACMPAACPSASNMIAGGGSMPAQLPLASNTGSAYIASVPMLPLGSTIAMRISATGNASPISKNLLSNAAPRPRNCTPPTLPSSLRTACPIMNWSGVFATPLLSTTIRPPSLSAGSAFGSATVCISVATGNASIAFASVSAGSTLIKLVSPFSTLRFAAAPPAAPPAAPAAAKLSPSACTTDSSFSGGNTLGIATIASGALVAHAPASATDISPVTAGAPPPAGMAAAKPGATVICTPPASNVHVPSKHVSEGARSPSLISRAIIEPRTDATPPAVSISRLPPFKIVHTLPKSSFSRV